MRHVEEQLVRVGEESRKVMAVLGEVNATIMRASIDAIVRGWKGMRNNAMPTAQRYTVTSTTDHDGEDIFIVVDESTGEEVAWEWLKTEADEICESLNKTCQQPPNNSDSSRPQNDRSTSNTGSPETPNTDPGTTHPNGES
jgi:hypothetical protein